jgi:hypothetical protein
MRNQDLWSTQPPPLLCPVPLDLHGIESFRLQDWSDKRIHLGHVAAQPEQPAAGPRDHQDHLHKKSLKICIKA